jgi:ribA/ribD-fused uncharacterized protein
MDIFGFGKPETRWLSNFYPCSFEYQDIIYPSSEHAYQAAKCKNLEDRFIISRLPTSSKAKRHGQKVELRSDWDLLKRNVMKEILREKFKLPGLKDALLATDDGYLEETNWWGDTYWGVCNGKGQNNLGLILMEIREELRDV